MKSDQASEARSFVEFNTLLSGLLFEVAKFSGLGVKVYLFVGVLQLRGTEREEATSSEVRCWQCLASGCHTGPVESNIFNDFHRMNRQIHHKNGFTY